MTDQELKKLKRADLLELLVTQGKENEQLKAQIEELTQQIANREIVKEEAGSIAEAALQLNGIFETAQAAASQYLENVQSLCAKQDAECAQREAESRQNAEQRLATTRVTCERLEAETKAKCDAMLAEAQQESEAYWTKVNQKMEDFIAVHKELREMFGEQNRKDADA